MIKLPFYAKTDTIPAEISYLNQGVYIPYDTLYLKVVVDDTKLEKLLNDVIRDLETNRLSYLGKTNEEMIARLREGRDLIDIDRSKAAEDLMAVAQAIAPFAELAELRQKIDYALKVIIMVGHEEEK
jgi:hypothetical protein